MLLFDHARERVAESIRHARPLQVALASLAAIILLAVLAEDAFFPIAFLGIALCLLVLWGNEFLLLMRAPDDAFPGRFDKPIWAAAILLLPPIGAPIFWAFRRAHWAEADAHAKPNPRPWLHDGF